MANQKQPTKRQDHPNGHEAGVAGTEELVHQMTERLEQITEEAQRLIHEADRRARETVRQRPMLSIWTSFGVGVGVGLAIAALLPSREESGWWEHMDDSLRDWSGRARHLGRNVADQAGHSLERLRQQWQ